MWKELLLHFTCDGEFVFQALALLLFLDQLRDRRRHFVERFAQCSKLIVLMNADAMAKVATADSQRRVIQIAYCPRNRAGEDDAGDKRAHLQREKNDSSKQEKVYEQRPYRSNGRQQTAIESRRTQREGCKHGRGPIRGHDAAPRSSRPHSRVRRTNEPVAPASACGLAPAGPARRGGSESRAKSQCGVSRQTAEAASSGPVQARN